MIPAHSLTSIEAAVDKTLGAKIERVRRRVPVDTMSLMIGGRPPPQRYEMVDVEERIEQWSKLVGILFCLPTTKLGKEEVLPNLDYFHHRSKHFVDFFCVGYGRYRPIEPATPNSVIKVGNDLWDFGVKDFDACRAELEERTKWTFSGESDLLLVVAKKSSSHELAHLDFSSAISCNLEAMLRDGAITSVRAFFENVFQFGQKYHC